MMQSTNHKLIESVEKVIEFYHDAPKTRDRFISIKEKLKKNSDLTDFEVFLLEREEIIKG